MCLNNSCLSDLLRIHYLIRELEDQRGSALSRALLLQFAITGVLHEVSIRDLQKRLDDPAALCVAPLKCADAVLPSSFNFQI